MNRPHFVSVDLFSGFVVFHRERLKRSLILLVLLGAVSMGSISASAHFRTQELPTLTDQEKGCGWLFLDLLRFLRGRGAVMAPEIPIHPRALPRPGVHQTMVSLSQHCTETTLAKVMEGLALGRVRAAGHFGSGIEVGPKSYMYDDLFDDLGRWVFAMNLVRLQGQTYPNPRYGQALEYQQSQIIDRILSLPELRALVVGHGQKEFTTEFALWLGATEDLPLSRWVQENSDLAMAQYDDSLFGMAPDFVAVLPRSGSFKMALVHVLRRFWRQRDLDPLFWKLRTFLKHWDLSRNYQFWLHMDEMSGSLEHRLETWEKVIHQIESARTAEKEKVSAQSYPWVSVEMADLYSDLLEFLELGMGDYQYELAKEGGPGRFSNQWGQVEGGRPWDGFPKKALGLWRQVDSLYWRAKAVAMENHAPMVVRTTRGVLAQALSHPASFGKAEFLETESVRQLQEQVLGGLSSQYEKTKASEVFEFMDNNRSLYQQRAERVAPWNCEVILETGAATAR